MRLTNAVSRYHVNAISFVDAGQERFKSITSSYFRGADGALLVYDASNRASFAGLTGWLKELNRRATEPVVKVLVANKADLSPSKVYLTTFHFNENLGLEIVINANSIIETLSEKFVSVGSAVCFVVFTSSHQFNNRCIDLFV